jgi:soluble lytic murein transglycosylase-like protein
MQRRAVLASLPAYFGLNFVARAAPALQGDLKDSVWAEAAAHAGLADPWIVYSIALFETGVIDAIGKMVPYPWSLDFGGRSVRANSRAEAAHYLDAVATTTNVDIGLMQINWASHHWRVREAADLLDPVVNIRVAGEILRIAIESAPDDLVLGLGHYHSWSDDSAREYGRAVWAQYFAVSGSRSVRRRERLV